MWAMARPTLLKKVAPHSRTSGRKLDAENFRRRARVAPLAKAGSTAAERAFPWKRGMAE